MSGARALLGVLVILALMTASVFGAHPAAAGSASDPDMEDASADAVSGRASRDLVAGWVSNETEDTIDFTLEMAELEPFTPYSDWQTLPVVVYEFFFDVTTAVGTSSYAAAATVPVHGPGAAFAQYDLMSVNYTPQGNVQDEVALQTVIGRYVFQSGIISFTVDKPFIGQPGRGDVIAGIWARITSASQRGASDAITEDIMLSHLNPGREFVLSGGATFYSVALYAENTSVNATAGEPAQFVFWIANGGEENVTVTLRNSTPLPTNWTLRTNATNYFVRPGENVSALVTITPMNTSNQTRRVVVNGGYVDDQGQNRTTDNAIQLSIYVPPTAGGDGGGGDGRPPPTPSFPWVQLAIGLGAVGGVVALWAAWHFSIGPKRRRERAKARVNKLSKTAWSRSPRSGPGLGGIAPRLGSQAGVRPPSAIPGRPPRP